MKLLGWMHRKFWQNSGDVFKDFAGVGGTCNCLSSTRSSPGEYDHHHQTYYSPKPQRERGLLHPTKPEELLAEEEEQLENVGSPFLFAGFLTIGTLGSAPIREEGEEEEGNEEEEEEEEPQLDAPDEDNFPIGLATPTFGVAMKPVAAMVEAITEKQAEATTAEDLVVVSSELEKLLAAEAEKETSSCAGRASSARPSIASVKAWASPECPLQGYLFGSPVEVAETAAARRERRASLGELFMRSRAAEEEGRKNELEEEGREEKAAGVVKRMMLKLHGSSRGSRGGDGMAAVSQTKFHKILQIFHRKVHPENTMEGKKSAKPCRKKSNEYSFHEGGSGAAGCCGVYIPRTANGNENTRSFKCHSVPSSMALAASDSNGNREHWIKTDADYLVLEL